MRVLLDHNVPHPLRHALTGHQVATAYYLGWGELINGELIQAAEAAGYDVMVTSDQNVYYQQNDRQRRLALVVLWTNKWLELMPHVREIVAVVDRATPGAFLPLKLPDRRQPKGPRLV